uniref:Uncharacterized protein n=1 Tax=viral metagenome TaxID=1070528 RepID=A0A6C0EVK8_9ZZZZ
MTFSFMCLYIIYWFDFISILSNQYIKNRIVLNV